jgi:hypothetical protein
MIGAKADVRKVIKELEDRLLPKLRKFAEEISEQFPTVKATVWSAPVGSLTDYQCHDLGIDCLLSDVGPDETDDVALSIGVKHRATTPLLEAGVYWGAPSGHVEIELFPDPIEATAETIQELEAGLPLLYDAIKTAVRRGQPPSET